MSSKFLFSLSFIILLIFYFLYSFCSSFLYLILYRSIQFFYFFQFKTLCFISRVLTVIQGLLGWYMVQSGLDQSIVENRQVPRVSQYRLAAHLASAFTIYIGCVVTGLQILRTGRVYSHATQTVFGLLAVF
jgi:heme A synthase